MKLKGLRGLSLAVLTLIPVMMGGWAFAQESSDGRPLPPRPAATREGMGAARQRLEGTVVGINPEKGTLAVKGTAGEAPIAVQVDEKTRIVLIVGWHDVLSASLKELLMGSRVLLATSPSPQGPPLAAAMTVIVGEKEKEKPQQSQPVSGQKGPRP